MSEKVITKATPIETIISKEQLAEMAEKTGQSAIDTQKAAEALLERIVAHPADGIEGISEEDAQRITDQRVETISVIERAIVTLLSVDKQFGNLSEQVETWITSHNNLVNHLNATLLDRDYLLGVIDERIRNIEETNMRQAETIEIKKLMTQVFFGDSDVPELETGQYLIYNVYPENPEQHTVEEIDSLSYNVVKVKDETGEVKHVNRREYPALFAAIALLFSEDYTQAVQNGSIQVTNVETKDGKPYHYIKQHGIYEMLSSSVSDVDGLEQA